MWKCFPVTPALFAASHVDQVDFIKQNLQLPDLENQ